jgi:hypothetical protein
VPQQDVYALLGEVVVVTVPQQPVCIQRTIPSAHVQRGTTPCYKHTNIHYKAYVAPTNPGCRIGSRTRHSTGVRVLQAGSSGKATHEMMETASLAAKALLKAYRVSGECKHLFIGCPVVELSLPLHKHVSL